MPEQALKTATAGPTSVITGGGGFIGKHLARLLIGRGHEVRIIDTQERCRRLPADIQRRAALFEHGEDEPILPGKAVAGCDYIFHFAGRIGSRNLERLMTVEVEQLKCSAAAALRQRAKLVFASSCAVYGQVHTKGKTSERVSALPDGAYAVAKRFCEVYLEDMHAEQGLQSAALRFFNVYGPGQNSKMVVPKLIGQALAGEALTISGDGRQIRDFLYVGDAVRASLLAAEKIEGFRVANVGLGRGCTINALAKQILHLTGSKSSIAYLPQRSGIAPGVSRRVADISLVSKLTGFVPATPLREGLKLAIAAHGDVRS